MATEQGSQHASSSELIARLVGHIGEGGAVLPIIGAGFSASAGVPVIADVETYLRYCIRQAVENAWHPQHDRWPDVAKAFEAPVSKTVLAQELFKQVERYPDNKGVLAAIGAMCDWRDSLTFLSRIRRCDKAAGDGAVRAPRTQQEAPRLELGAPSGVVADSLFNHLTAGKEPGLGHMMLAHLADGFRTRLILTTNFDRLIETAFERAGMPLETVDVQLRSDLPRLGQLTAARSLIKMHGGHYSLRADYTLDEMPSKQDEKTFESYLDDRWLRNWPEQCGSRHVLVMGISGKEQRTISLLTSALAVKKDMRIHWVCFAEKEPAEVRDAFEVVEATLPRGENGALNGALVDRLHTYVVRDTGHLLFELFQHLHCSLPPAGASLPAVHRVAPDLYDSPDAYSDNFDGECERLRARLISLLGSGENKRPIVCSGGQGASSVAARVFEEFSGLPSSGRGTHCHCIWIDLDYCLDVEHFRAILVDAVAQKLGLTARIPPLPHFPNEACSACLADLTSGSRAPVLVFINGRDGPGVNAGWEAHSSPEGWKPDQVEQFWKCLNVLSAEAPKLAMVVLCREVAEQPWRLSAPSVPEHLSIATCHKLELTEVVEDVIQWLLAGGEESSHRIRFVYALTLMRRSRHPATTLSWAFIKAIRRGAHADNTDARPIDNDEKRYQISRRWLRELQDRKVGRTQQGGCFWMHDDVRRALSARLERQFPEVAKYRAECHQGIADWYLKLFRASSDPSAALESIYHRLCCCRDQHGGDNPARRGELARTSLLAAIETLVLARPEIIARGHVRASVKLLGSLIETCRVEELKNTPEKQWWERLERKCRELQRDYHHEIADFAMTLDVDGLHAPEARSAHQVQTAATDEAMYRTAIAHLGMRDYRIAWDEFVRLLRKLEVDLPLRQDEALVWPIQDTQDWSQSIVDSRVAGSKLGTRHAGDQSRLQMGIRAIRRLMFLVMLRAQLHKLNHPDDQEAVTNGFVYAECLYVIATAAMRFVEDHDFIQVENAFLRTHAGIALARLGRFTEAQRRLYEASGYLAASSKAGQCLPWAVIDLRRAEMHLEHFDREMESGRRIAVAHAALDRADQALERAVRRLDMHPTDVWWRALYYELQLRLRAAIASVSGPCKQCRTQSATCLTFSESCHTLVKNVTMLIDKDVYRIFRCLDHLYQPGPRVEVWVHPNLHTLFNKPWPVDPDVKAYFKSAYDRAVPATLGPGLSDSILSPGVHPLEHQVGDGAVGEDEGLRG